MIAHAERAVRSGASMASSRPCVKSLAPMRMATFSGRRFLGSSPCLDGQRRRNQRLRTGMKALPWPPSRIQEATVVAFLGPEGRPERAAGLLERWVATRAAESEGTLAMLPCRMRHSRLVVVSPLIPSASTEASLLAWVGLGSGSGLALGLGLGSGLGSGLGLGLGLRLGLGSGLGGLATRLAAGASVRREAAPVSKTRRSNLGQRALQRHRLGPAGSPEASFGASPCPRLPQASTSLGQSAPWAARLWHPSHTGLASDMGPRVIESPRKSCLG